VMNVFGSRTPAANLNCVALQLQCRTAKQWHARASLRLNVLFDRKAHAAARQAVLMSRPTLTAAIRGKRKRRSCGHFDMSILGGHNYHQSDGWT
jgi:hypothetical protein